MISASKTTFSHYNLKILRPKVTKNLTNLRKKHPELSEPTRFLSYFSNNSELLTRTDKLGYNDHGYNDHG
jgi:hypothetical protein